MLPERERLVLSLSYYEGLTLEEIGLGAGRTGVSLPRIHASAFLHVRYRLVECGCN